MTREEDVYKEVQVAYRNRQEDEFDDGNPAIALLVTAIGFALALSLLVWGIAVTMRG